MRKLLTVPMLLCTAACDEVVAPPAPPSISNVAVTTNALNALSAIVTARVDNADSVYVVYWADRENPRSTAYYPVHDNAAYAPIMGLKESVEYSQALFAVGPGGSALSPVGRFESGKLPEFFANLGFDVSGSPPSGYILAGSLSSRDTAQQYVFAYDLAEQRFSWYCHVRTLGAYAAQQPNGNFVAVRSFSNGYQAWHGDYVELTPACEIVQVIDPAPMYPDGHDFIADADGYHFFPYEVIDTNLTSLGGFPDARIAFHYLRRVEPGGSVELDIDFSDYFSFDDWIEWPLPKDLKDISRPDRPRKEFDYDHPNSVVRGPDGNYIVSFRNFGSIVKFDYFTGEVIWVLGGRQNHFNIIGDPLHGFSAQHSVKAFECRGKLCLLVFDNGPRHVPPESRGVIYEVDETAKTAIFVQDFRHDPPLYTGFVGSAQRLADGTTLVGFAAKGILTAFDPTGNAKWELKFSNDNPGGRSVVYRFQYLCSLYRPCAQ